MTRHQPPRIVLLAADTDVWTNARVLKTAHTAAGLGMDVWVLANGSDARTRCEAHDDFHLAFLPVPHALQQFGRSWVRTQRAGNLPSRYPDLASETGEILRLARLHTWTMMPNCPERLRAAYREALGAHEKRKGNLASAYGDDAGIRDDGNQAVGYWPSILFRALDLDAVYSAALTVLDPDIVHAHDVPVLGSAFKFCATQQRAGRSVPWVYDAQEWREGMFGATSQEREELRAWASYEEDFAPLADEVTTVSPGLARRLADKLKLKQSPSVILNAPLRRASHEPVTPLRQQLGIEAATPLVVYSGQVGPDRGVQVAIEAIADLPGVHLAFVCVPSTQALTAQRLREFAGELGLSHRVHLVDPVEPTAVIDHLRGASVGLVLLERHANADIALPNKLFDYVHAGVPVVASAFPELSRLILELGIGRAFEPSNPKSLAIAIRDVLADEAAMRHQGRAVLDALSWDRQGLALEGIYRSLLQAAGQRPHPYEADPQALTPMLAAECEDAFAAIETRPMRSRALLETLEADPLWHHALSQAVALCEEGRADLSMVCCEQAFKAQGADVDAVLLVWIGVAWEANDRGRAVELMRMLRERRPEDDTLAERHAYMLLEVGDPKTALAIADRLLEANPSGNEARQLRDRAVSAIPSTGRRSWARLPRWGKG